MLRFVIAPFAASVMGVLTATTAIADVALLVGNRNYQRASWMYGAEKVLDTAPGFRNLGYDVLIGRDMGIEQMRRALQGMMERVPDSERIAIALNGHFVNSENVTWFVPVDANPVNRISVNFEGISLSVLLDVLGTRPGGAALFLGTDARDIQLGQGMKAGIGPLDIPQGVFVAIGKPDDIATALNNDFLQANAGFASALTRAPSSVKGYGFISDRVGLGDQTRGSGQNDAARVEEGFWRALVSVGTEQAMQLYLNTYPGGAYARDAREFIAQANAQSPIEKAREDEARLGLSRNDRKKIQENLSLLGYDTNGIDGVLGRGSRRAIAAWQSDQDFEPTGYLKRNQINRLNRLAKRKAADLAEEARRKQAELDDADRAFWNSSGAKDGNERGLRRYLRNYPDGLFSDVAEARLEIIEEAKRNQISGQERRLWESVQTADTPEAYQDYLDRYPSGAFVEEAQTRLAKLNEEAESEANLEAAKKQEDELRMNNFGRLLVERQLARLGFETGPTDGNFTKETRKAIRKFQRTRGFEPTGYLTRESIVRLIAEAGGG